MPLAQARRSSFLKIGGGVKAKRICLFICIVLSLGILGYYKYFAFGIAVLNRFLHLFHLNEVGIKFDILLPVGISFYTLQALGYLIDVYRGDTDAEKNFLKYALFVSFFPQLVAGPIERSENLLTQLSESHVLQYDNFRKGILLLLYGLFLKMVIADRAAAIVDTVYGDNAGYPGLYIVVATVFFAIQIYCDFYGYSTIARGSALLMGIRLMDNFNAPYYARNVKEFWCRWHISLSGWFRDYLYIPLGGSRKGDARKEGNRLLVFGLSGLWHGASLSYVLWGALNGIYQVFEDAADRLKEAVSVRLTAGGYRTGDIEAERFSRPLFQRIVTFVLISLTMLIFRAGSLEAMRQLLLHLFSAANPEIFFDGSLYGLGVEEREMHALLISIFVLFTVDYQKYKDKDPAAMVLKQGWWFRYLAYAALFFMILIFGCYGDTYDAQQFIYFQF